MLLERATMWKWSRIAISGSLLVGSATSAVAAAPAKAFIQNYDAAAPTERIRYELILSDMYEGMGSLNDYLHSIRHEARVFCPPAELVVTGNQLISMVRQFLRHDPRPGNFPIGVVLLFAIKDVFPCPSQ